MSIISASMPDTLIEEIDNIAESQGYTGRSDIIRAALRMFIAQQKDLDKVNGKIEGVLIVLNKERCNSAVSQIRHEHNEVVNTHVHNHLKSHMCLQLFVVDGAAESIKQFKRDLEAAKVEYAHLYVS